MDLANAIWTGYSKIKDIPGCIYIDGLNYIFVSDFKNGDPKVNCMGKRVYR